MRFPFALKLGLAITLLSVGVTSGVLTFFYVYTKDTIIEQMRGRLSDVGHAGTFLFGAEERQMILKLKQQVLAKMPVLKPENLQMEIGDITPILSETDSEFLHQTKEFQHLVQLLRQIQAGSSSRVQPLHYYPQNQASGQGAPLINFTYLMVAIPQSPDYQVIMFIADSNYNTIDVNNNGIIEPEEEGNPIGNLYRAEYEVFSQPFIDGEIHAEEEWYSDQWGTFISAAIPIKDQQGKVIATLGLDYLVSNQDNQLKRLMYISIGIFVISLVLSMVLAIILTNILNRPVQALRQGAEQVRQRNFDVHFPILSRDELGLLAETFNVMVKEIKQYAEGLEGLVRERTKALEQANEKITVLNRILKQENVRLSAEVAVARQLQMMVLPKKEELLAVKGIDIAAYMDPADEVGGDYYDVLLEDSGWVKIGIGDVTGHGLESGVLMLMVQTAVRTLLASGQSQPELFYSIVNKVIYQNIQRINSEKNMTLSLLDYRPSGEIDITGQHEDVIVVREDKQVELINTMNLGLPIGLDEDITDFVSKITITLKPKDILLLHTDGITEAEDIHNVQYGIERLAEQVVKYHDKYAEIIKQAIIDDVLAHIGKQKIFDDITLVVVKRC